MAACAGWSVEPAIWHCSLFWWMQIHTFCRKSLQGCEPHLRRVAAVASPQAGLAKRNSASSRYRELYPALRKLANTPNGRMEIDAFDELLSGAKEEHLKRLVSDSIVVAGPEYVEFEWQAAKWYVQEFLPLPAQRGRWWWRRRA